MELYRIYSQNIPDFILELSQTAPLLRLRDVGMNCGCQYTSFPLFRGLRPYSRFDHSLGAALILWNFTGDKTAAASALLHDIATPVMSHVVDFLRGDHLTQEATEAGTQDIILGDRDICSILEKNGISPPLASDPGRFPLGDNPSPRLCADRLEYTLGNSVNYGFASAEKAAEIYEDLIAAENEFGSPELVFRHENTAKDFAFAALKCSEVYVSDPDRLAMQVLSDLLAEALSQEVINEADLMKTEPELIEKLENSPLSSRWESFRALSRTFTSDTPVEGYFCRVIPAKKRRIDPYVLGKGRMSLLCPEFGMLTEAFMSRPQDYYVCGI